MVIYKTTNLINGKIYIGQSSKNDIKYLGSGKILHNAIKKYGSENFTKEVLEECSDKSQLNYREIYWISYFNSTDPNIGYNISDGGNGGNLGTKVNDAISKSVKKIYTDPNSVYNSVEYKEKLSRARKGKAVSEETRKKISESQRGEKGYWYGKKGRVMTEEIKQKLRDVNLGKKHSEERKKKSSDKHKGQIPWNRGKKNIYSENTLIKMSKAKKGIPRPNIAGKLKQYYSENLSGKCKPIIDTRTGRHFKKVKELREELGISEYMVKQLIIKRILIWTT